MNEESVTTNPDNNKPEDVVKYSDFAKFADSMIGKMAELVSVVKVAVEHDNALRDRRLDRIERAMGLEPIE